MGVDEVMGILFFSLILVAVVSLALYTKYKTKLRMCCIGKRNYESFENVYLLLENEEFTVNMT